MPTNSLEDTIKAIQEKGVSALTEADVYKLSFKMVEAFDKNVARLAKPGEDIIRDLTPHSAALYVAASCLMGDAAEVFDVVKKYTLYRKPLDLRHLKEELGDTLFYLYDVLRLVDTSAEECMTINMDKLQKRYPDGYTNESAQARADKTTVEVEAPELEPRDPGE